MDARLRLAFDEFEADSTVNVGVLVGTGGTFSTGIDMKCADSVRNLGNGSGKLQRTHFRKPMVCGIGGYCLAGGLELALMCDLRVVEEDATLGFFNRRFGVPMADGIARRLSGLIGQSRALDLILTGRPIAGKEALDMGLANRMVATGTALGQAVNIHNCFATVLAYNECELNSETRFVRLLCKGYAGEKYRKISTIIDALRSQCGIGRNEASGWIYRRGSSI